MSLVLYVRLPLILAAKLVGLFFTIALKKKKKKNLREVSIAMDLLHVHLAPLALWTYVCDRCGA